MAKMTNTEIIRNRYMSLVRDALINAGEEVLVTKSNTFAIPWAEGDDEGYVTFTISIPKGSRDGDFYDGHEEAKDYAMKLKEKEQKKKENEEKKAKKIEADKKKREERKKLKEEKEEKKGE